MKVVIGQNEVGRFNLLGNEKSLAFNIRIIDGDEGAIVERNGVKAMARLSESEDPEGKRDELRGLYEAGEIEGIVDQCLEGGRDTEETKVFIEVFIDNYPELKRNFEETEREKIERRIQGLKDELKSLKFTNGFYEMANLVRSLADKEKASADRYSKWASDYKKSSPQYKDYTKKAVACNSRATELMGEYEALWQKCEEISLTKRKG